MQEERNGSPSFDRPPTKEELIALYQNKEAEDPASVYYKRKLTRPPLYPVRTSLFVLAALLLAAVAGVLVHAFWDRTYLAVLAGFGVLLCLSLLFLKRICIYLVRVYQHFAPEKVRNRCRYEPSCSDYMILALTKHGLFRGLKMGIRRLLRCKPPNGGIDLP